jgi:acyl-CoA thioester hydrolase
MSRVTRYRHQVRYFETDQQGVVFNMWYLGYFDEAMTAFLAEGGLAYADLIAEGYDVQLVHSEIDWRAPLRFGDQAVIEVRAVRVGRSSFSLAFAIEGNAQVHAETTYVVVATDGSGSRPMPHVLGAALA